MAEVPWVVRFVDKPDPDRKVRLDLNDEEAGGDLFVDPENFSLGTAELLAALVESMLDDTGGRVVATRRVNREVTVPVVVKGMMPTFAARLGDLAREADRKHANWLEFKPAEHTGESVFFEVLQGDIGDVGIDPPDQDPDDASVERPVTLTLLCKPTAVGVEVSGQVTTSPDVTDPANRPFVALTTVRGDVPAPLTIKIGPSATGPTGPIMVSVCSGPPTLTGPLYAQAETLTSGTGATNGNDAAMTPAGAGNNYTRLTFTAPNDLDTLRLSGDIAAVPPGRYRVWARLRNTLAADTFDLRLDIGTAASGVTGAVKSFKPAGANNAYWFPLADVEHPYYQPDDATAPENLTLRFYAMRTTSGGAGNLDVDLFLLVPLDLRGSNPGRVGLATPSDTLGTGARWVFRPDQEMVHPTTPARPVPVIGSADFRAVPGERTYIHMLRRTYPGVAMVTGTNQLEWSYRPRYQYVSAPA